MEVCVKNNNIEEAIRKLKKKVQSSGLLRELKRSAFYETRTQRRRKKDQVALKRANKNQRRREAWKRRMDG